MADDIFDEACFSGLIRDVGEGPGRKALGMFLADIAARLDRVDEAASAKSLHTLAHSIKSSAAMFGLHQLSAQARSLEADAALPAADLAPRVDALRQAFAAARAVVVRQGRMPG